MRQVEKDVLTEVLEADRVKSGVRGDLAGTVEETCAAERSSRAVLAGDAFQHAGHSWDWSQVDYEPEEREVMDWPHR